MDRFAHLMGYYEKSDPEYYPMMDALHKASPGSGASREERQFATMYLKSIDVFPEIEKQYSSKPQPKK
jgi:hypothetical protein